MPTSDRGGPTPLLSRDRLTVGVAGTLAIVSVLCWLEVLDSMPMMAMNSTGEMGVASLVSSLSVPSVGLFELIWVVGMAAMMFPAMIPIVLFYNRFSTKTESNPSLAKAVGTPLFLAGYLADYAALGLLVYVSVYAAVGLSSVVPALAPLAVIAPGTLLVAAGLYQLTPGKSNFLMRCVSPTAFFTLHSSRGLLGSLRMGIAHGRYCVGCCWAYMLVMFAVALMSIPFMVALSVVIALEKVVVRGALWFTRAIAVGFIMLGIASIAFPGVLSLLSAGL
jgi:predicted metal-binding membrane protein